MADDKADVWQGTLALMILKTLETLGPLHGYGVARRIDCAARVRSLAARNSNAWADNVDTRARCWYRSIAS